MSARYHYTAITAVYWAFTLVDGALRTLVLLFFHQLGYSPFQLAALFVLYEAAGIFSNILGGWLATHFGAWRMLLTGVLLELGALGALLLLGSNPASVLPVAGVMLAQGLAGVAKDVTKTAAKSALKTTAGADNTRLFRWVAWFTGSKNALKGTGFLLGGVLLDAVGFRAALVLMAGTLVAAILLFAAAVPQTLGKGKASRSFKALFAKTRAINVMASARLFLFGARDVWFAVGLPVFLQEHDWSAGAVAAFLAVWTIGYGGIQALAPRIAGPAAEELLQEVRLARKWSAGLICIPLVVALGLMFISASYAVIVVALGVSVFGLGFALMSSIHSYLVLAFAGSEKAAEDIGFYYAANAAGRLLGLLLSGALAQFGGLTACMFGSSIMLACCAALMLKLPSKN
jgi:predicted MFS family arabinose efflux permease